MAKLSSDEIQIALAKLPGWARQGDAIGKTYQFSNFVQSVAFVNKIADAAEAVQHHPDIDIRYDKVTIGLSTHDEGGISDKDADLAGKIEGLA